jgi:hypothetical protein
MASSSYLTPGNVGDFTGIPKPEAPIAKPNSGAVEQAWWRFFNAVAGTPSTESAVVVGASPTAFKATQRGQLLVTGGTVSSITVTRKNTYTPGGTSGYFPMSPGDVVTITYTGLPTVTFFPS